jgi:hypothetical protein
MDLAEVGRIANLGYGRVEGVRAHLVAGGATALLSANITSSQTSLQVEDASRFPAAPFTVQAGYERMRVTAVAGNEFTVERAYDGTIARAHLRNKTLYEVRTEYVYLVSPEPVKTVSRVLVDGRAQGEGFTSYTGQSGDEHTDFPGSSVIAFSAEAWIGPQRGLDTQDAAAREQGEAVEAPVDWASHPEITDGSDTSFITLSPTGFQSASVAFAEGDGMPLTQAYALTVENTGAEERALRAVVSHMETGAVSLSRKAYIPASTKTDLVLMETAGKWRSVITLMPEGPDIRIYKASKTLTRTALPSEGDSLARRTIGPELTSDHRTSDGTASGAALSPTGRLSAWASYPAEGPGQVFTQTHRADVKNTGGASAVLKLISSEPGGQARAVTTHTLAAGSEASLSHTHDGGTWETMTRVTVQSGQVSVKGLMKDVSYATEDTLSERALAHTASARAVIGNEIRVDAEWAADDASGTYTGSPGALIERPDHVIKHFIVERMGFDLSDIDSSSFDSAGASYASAVTDGYSMGFVINEGITPSDFLRRLAFECRSTVRYQKGKWVLDFIPDIAPAPVKTISKDELAGEGSMFRFSLTPPSGLGNNLTARYRKSHDTGGSGWEAIASASDTSSKTKYGTYIKEYAFGSLRDNETAEHVLEHILLEQKAPLLTVEFPVFWEHFDLEAGDTLEIENPIYNGKKFFIERIDRTDRFRAMVTAREWRA